jgi:hypothetical protein
VRNAWLHNITEEDAVAEGVQYREGCCGVRAGEEMICGECNTARDAEPEAWRETRTGCGSSIPSSPPRHGTPTLIRSHHASVRSCGLRRSAEHGRIAARLGISAGSVRNYLSEVTLKLGGCESHRGCADCARQGVVVAAIRIIAGAQTSS